MSICFVIMRNLAERSLSEGRYGRYHSESDFCSGSALIDETPIRVWPWFWTDSESDGRGISRSK
jgi:hypothetical protein